MLRQTMGAVILAAGGLLSAAAPAEAQFFGMFGGDPGCNCGGGQAQMPVYRSSYFDNCGSCQTAAAEQVMVHQPISQTCYQTVPVVEYQQVKQMVSKPIVETQYEERQFTEYVPVTEQKTVSVPTVSYQDITEQRQVTKNMGYWQTKYAANAKMQPCQYDSRPNFLGWMNRTGFQMRSAFQPSHVATREYVARTCVQNIPVTRRVAVQGTRQVTYNVTNYTTKTVSRQVPVTKVTYKQEEVVVNRPMTVMRTVPIGSQMAYAPGGIGTAYLPFGAYPTQIVTGPQPDPISSARQQNDRARTADRDLENANPERRNNQPVPAGKISYPVYRGQSDDESDGFQPVNPAPTARRQLDRASAAEDAPVERVRTFSVPKRPQSQSIARVGQWVARNKGQLEKPENNTDMALAGVKE